MIGGSRGCDASRAAVAAAAETLRAGFNGQLPLRRPSACPLPRFRYPGEMDSLFYVCHLPPSFFFLLVVLLFPSWKTETFGGRERERVNRLREGVEKKHRQECGCQANSQLRGCARVGT